VIDWHPKILKQQDHINQKVANCQSGIRSCPSSTTSSYVSIGAGDDATSGSGWGARNEPGRPPSKVIIATLTIAKKLDMTIYLSSTAIK
jgi:hypothetical protein